jgi:hypothetical protein
LSTARSWPLPGAVDWVFDREQLWNAVEAAERRKDAQLAREIEIGRARARRQRRP